MKELPHCQAQTWKMTKPAHDNTRNKEKILKAPTVDFFFFLVTSFQAPPMWKSNFSFDYLHRTKSLHLFSSPNVFQILVKFRASLVDQGWRIRLPMHKTWIQSFIMEDSTSLRATKPMRHSYWVCALEPGNHSYWSLHALESVLSRKRRRCSEKPAR